MLSKTTVVLLVLTIIAATSNAERQVVRRRKAKGMQSSKAPKTMKNRNLVMERRMAGHETDSPAKSSKSPKGSKSSKSPKDSNSMTSSVMLEASSGMNREAVTAAAIAGAATLGLFL